MRDHSCFIAIQNILDVELTQLGFETGHGYFASLAPGKTAPVFHVKDCWGKPALRILSTKFSSSQQP